MSDDEDYEYDYDSDDDQYCSGDEEEQDEVAIEIENSFYEADDCRQDDPKKALEMYERVVELEKGRDGEVKWRFKALEQIVCLQFRLDNFNAMVERYKELLSYMNTVTRNECTDAINSILDTVSSSTNYSILEQMYDQTLTALRDANNERLWFNTNVKLVKMLLESSSSSSSSSSSGAAAGASAPQKEGQAGGDQGGGGGGAPASAAGAAAAATASRLNRVGQIVRALHASCKKADGGDDGSKGTYLLEVYALQIQLCAARGDVSTLRSIYPKTQQLDAAIADPRIMGVIREEGGRMYMREGRWQQAYNELYEAFSNYQEAGNRRAKDCLKLVVLANMLALSDINPFDSREAKVFKDDKEICAMIQLRQAYEQNDVTSFEKLLRDKRNRITTDPFIMTYVDPLLRKIRAQVLLSLVKPYKKIKISFIAKELNISSVEVEELCVQLILDKDMFAQLDQVRGFLLLGGAKTSLVSKKFEALEKLSSRLEEITAGLDKKS